MADIHELLESTVNAYLEKCTRVEVITSTGRDYVNWDLRNKVKVEFQDDNRTLKIFIK